MTNVSPTRTWEQARGVCFVAAVAAAVFLWGAPVGAQSLDDQYTHYLLGKCEQMGFARDLNNVLLPGQAGPHLQAYCSGPPLTGGVTETSSTGGGAGAEELSNQGGEEDRALKRRRKRLDSGTGPSDPADTELAHMGGTSVFLSLDYLHERQQGTQYESGRNSSGYGGLLGADYRFGTNALAGVAVRYAEQSGTIASGGNFSTHAPGVRLYGSWLPLDGLYIDAAAGFDRRNLDTTRIVGLKVVTFGHGGPGSVSFNPPLAPAESSTHERITSAELQAGYDFRFTGLAAGPRAALAIAHSRLDPYIETGDTPMTLAFDEQTRTSLRSLIGLQATRAFNGPAWALVPQLNADWVHEYRDDQQVLTARFAEDLRPNPTELRFLNNRPDRDWFVFRLSTVAVLAHGFSLFVAAEASAGNSYVQRYLASLGARLEL